MQRLREREVDSKVVVTDAEVDNYLATVGDAGRRRERIPARRTCCVRVPEQATPDQIEQRRKRAEEALAQIKSRHRLRQVAASYSDAPDALHGRRPRLAHAGAAADGVRRRVRRR